MISLVTNTAFYFIMQRAVDQRTRHWLAEYQGRDRKIEV
jgi:hypothetical protein